MGASEDSLRRFTELWLKVDQPLSSYSQTLTLASEGLDYEAAKKLLYRLLDNIGKRFPDVIMLWVAGVQERRAYHFHVVVLAYTKVSPRWVESLKQAFWNAWQRLQGGAANRHGNLFKEYPNRFKDRSHLIGYYAKEIADLPSCWWGSRNQKLIKLHNRVVKAREITAAIASLPHLQSFITTRRKPVKKPRLVTMRLIKRLKDRSDVELRSWEDFKRQTTGQTGKVTDKEMCEFLKAGLKNGSLSPKLLKELNYLWGDYPAIPSSFAPD